MLLVLLCLTAGIAQAQAPTRPIAPAQVKANLDRILADPQFRAPTTGETALSRALHSAADQWNRFRKWLNKWWDRLTGIPRALKGAVGLQWVFIALFLLLAAYILYRIFRVASTYKEKYAERARPVIETETEKQALPKPEHWLAQARQFAADADYRQAVRAMFLAMLTALDQAGAVAYDRARTNGDYLRLLRGKNLGPVVETFAPVAREFERHWYGDTPAAEADYRHSAEAYERLTELLHSPAPANAALAPQQTAPAGKA